MEPGTGLTILGTAVGSAKLLEKLLGPTADYLGNELRTYTEMGVRNLARIFRSASRKLGSNLETPGQIPVRVLGMLLRDGYFCEDELSAEYFGGVLASSRTGQSRDDRGVTYVSIIGRLSAYQIRTHYVLYTLFKDLYDGIDVNLGAFANLQGMLVYIPDCVFLPAMSFLENEDPDTITAHTLSGLESESLIGSVRYYDDPEFMETILGIRPDTRGLVFCPSIRGMELFLWVHGQSAFNVRSFLDKDLQFERLVELEIRDGAVKFHR